MLSGFWIFGITEDSNTGDIDVSSILALIGEDEIDGFGPLFLLGFFFIVEHFTIIVAISNTDITDTLFNGFSLSAVIALWFTREIIFEFSEPGFGFIITVVSEDIGEESEVIGIVTTSDADFTFPFGECHIFIGIDSIFRESVTDVEESSASGESGPIFSFRAQSERDFIEDGFLDFFEESLAFELVEFSDTDIEEDVSLDIFSFLDNAFGETFF